jgi:hypothetical protein
MARKKSTSKKKQQSIIVQTNDLPQNNVISLNPDLLMMRALESNVDVSALKELVIMRNELLKEQSRREYFNALSKFQSICPIIKKTKAVYNKDKATIRYHFAPLDSIIDQVSEFLQECGFSYTIDVDPGNTKAIVTSNHIGGHSEKSEFPIIIDDNAYMNPAQKVASAQTFAKRYAFNNVFGIMTGDDDDDGISSGNELSAKDIFERMVRLMAAVLENYGTIMAIKKSLGKVNEHNVSDPDFHEAALVLNELDDKTFQCLWVAPSKGGPFTTLERSQITDSVVPIIKEIRRNQNKAKG